MPKSREYWKERFLQLEEASNKKGRDVIAEIDNQYRKAQQEIEAKILVWYQRFADNNNISLSEARKRLTSKELEELKWSVKEYIKYGKENAISEVWMKQLENASARFHITRLEALELQLQQEIEKLYGNELDQLDRGMKAIYLDGYYHTAYEVQKGFKIAWDIAAVDNKQLGTIISKPWAVDGKNFSERIWVSKTKLLNEMHTELTQSIMLGRSPDKVIRNIAKRMDVSKVQAGRLVMTEQAYFSSVAQKKCFDELDVDKYEIVATLDSHTSEICRSLDGKVFDMKDYVAGSTAPPFHVWCRTTTVPWFPDNYGKRVARKADGKIHYIDADIKFNEWYENYIVA